MSIVVTSRGVDAMCWGDAVGPVMWVIDIFFCNEGLDGGAVSVRYDVRVSSGMSVSLMYVYHVGWARMDDCVGSLCSLRCGVVA